MEIERQLAVRRCYVIAGEAFRLDPDRAEA
jgi:hypothetical protein